MQMPSRLPAACARRLLKWGVNAALRPPTEVSFTNFLREIFAFIMSNLPGKWWADTKFQRTGETGRGAAGPIAVLYLFRGKFGTTRSEEHTSELQSRQY